jgi:hypothetical protein
VREDRIAVYRRAIVEGEAKLSRIRVLYRFAAIQAAMLDGLRELEPTIMAYYGGLSDTEKADLPLPCLALNLSLREGASDRRDAERRAAAKLTNIADADLPERLDEDPVFRRVFLEVARKVCTIHPFTRETDPECEPIIDIYVKQMRGALGSSDREEAKTRVLTSPWIGTIGEILKPHWGTVRERLHDSSSTNHDLQARDDAD